MQRFVHNPDEVVEDTLARVLIRTASSSAPKAGKFPPF
jgi:hypothetical protein